MQPFSSGEHRLSDDDIVLAIREGKKEYFSVLVDRYADKLGRYAFNMMYYNRDLTNDCIQEVFLKIREKLEHYTIGTNFNAWIYKITHNIIINMIKKTQQKENFYSIDDKEVIFEENKLEHIDDKFRQNAIKKVLGNIDEKSRSIILLYYYEEKSYEEISTIMNISKNTVGTKLSRIKTKIKNILTTEELLFYFS